MRIAVDAMGSDGAPDVEIEGAVQASLASDIELILVGDEDTLNGKLAEFPKRGNIRVVHATEAIGMNEAPMSAVRKKKDSSLSVALRLVKNGDADAVVTAGNTGAVILSARGVLGRVRGATRVAICQTLPTLKGRVVVLDLGANVDCTVRHLCEFAEMGTAYSQYSLGVEAPTVGLLNIGEEDVKGGQVSKEVHSKLKETPHVNFVGNVEPSGLFRGEVDVVVCDGFTGNLVLKTSEAVAGFVSGLMREKFESSSMNKLAAKLASRSLREIKEKVDPNEHFGAPLLGVDGIVTILHGSSSPVGLANAIEGARVSLKNNLLHHIHENIQELRSLERRVATPSS
jgi:glycerol-3-phosphate acyltransferase PlsX